MTRLLVFLILSLSFAVSVQAQKVHRAAKAMYELKFDKSFELFDEVLEKEPENVIALVGFAKARLRENELKKNPIQLEILQHCYDNLLKGKSGLQNIKEDDAKLLMIDLRVFNAKSIDTLLEQTSNLIWNYYIKEEKSISKFEFFQANYYKDNLQNPARLVGYKLDKLYYDSLSNINTFSAYNFYLDKFDKTKLVKGIYSNDAKSKILGIEYKEAIDAKGAEKLIQFVTKNKIKNLEGIAKKTFEELLIPTTREIEKREYARALASPGVSLLETFINDYKSAPEVRNAKDSIEHRYYYDAQAKHLLTNYETFLNRYKSSVFKNEIEDSVVAIRFRTTINSNNKSDLTNFIDQSTKFHKSNLIKSLIDSTNSRIYNLEFIDANNSSELVTILEFYRKYKNSSYPNFSTIQKKLINTWEQAILKENSSPDENGLVNFIHEFSNEPSTTFNKVIDATKSGLTRYAEKLKPSLVTDVLYNASNDNIYINLSTEKIESLSNVIASKISITNTSNNKDILERLKNLNSESSPSLLEIFMNFFGSFTVSNSYIESLYTNNDRCFIFGYNTKEKFTTKLLLWDDSEMKYKEVDLANKDNILLRTFMAQNGIANLSSYLGPSRSKYNYVLIGSKINNASLINLMTRSNN
jgi:hypothetical protein